MTTAETEGTGGALGAPPHAPEKPQIARRAGRALAFAAFFLSGASSLVFQSIWSRMLHLVFGGTSLATSTTVTAFMAGLGLGAFLAGRYAHRIRRPLRAYALAEAGVALFAIVLPYLLDPEGFLSVVNAWLRESLGANSIGFMFARFFCVLPILLVPTTLMGASLPLLSRHFVDRERGASEVGASVGALYAVNTFGAVLGVATASFALMPAIGVRGTNLVAVGANLALAAVLLFVSRGGGDVVATTISAPDPAPTHDDEGGPAPSKRQRRAAIAAFAFAGAASLCLEVVWTRSLVMTIGTSVYSFAIILVAFLVGIAGGSSIASSVVSARTQRHVAYAVFTIVLTLLANATRALVSGVGTWLVFSWFFAVPIVLLAVAARVRVRRLGRDAGDMPSVIMLLVPLTAVIVNQSVAPEGMRVLADVLVAVVVSICALLAILVLLRREAVLTLAMVQLFIGAATYVNYVFQDEIPCAFASMVQSLTHSVGSGVERVPLYENVGLVQFFMFCAAGLCTLPSTLGMGAMFPLTLRLFTRGGETAAEDVGTVYGANTLGSIVGAWLPGFVLMPILGAEATLLLGLAVNLVLALVLVVVAGDDRPAPFYKTIITYIVAPLVPAMLALGTFLYLRGGEGTRWDLERMSLGVFRMSLVREAGLCARRGDDPADILFYRDGITTTVSVERFFNHLALKNNGKVDASNSGDMPTQIMVGVYPLVLHPRGPRNLDVAMVGFGSGMTVGSVLKFPIRSLDVMELERAIPEAARFFQDDNNLRFPLPRYPFVQMPRLNVIDDDARNFLASTRKTYDVIISEPSNPWITGVSDLFTADHYRIAKRRLRPGGLYLQWIQVYELSPEHIKSAYRTFVDAFPHVIVFAADDFSTDTILIGSDSPIGLDYAHIAEGYALPGIREEVARAHVRSPYDMLARVLFRDRDEAVQFARIEEHRRGGRWRADARGNNDPARRCTGDCRRPRAPLNTDDNMLIELGAPRDLIGFEAYEGFVPSLYAFDWPYGHLAGRVTGMGEGAEGSARWSELALAVMAHGRRLQAAELLQHAARVGQSPETVVAAEVLTLLQSNRGEPLANIETPLPGPQLAEREARLLNEGFAAVREAVDRSDFDAAYQAMATIPVPVRRHSGPSLRYLEGYLLFKTGERYPSRFQDAGHIFEDLVRTQPAYVQRHAEIYYFMAQSFLGDMRFDRAVDMMRVYVGLRNAAERGIAVTPVLPDDPRAPRSTPEGETPPSPPSMSPPARP